MIQGAGSNVLLGNVTPPVTLSHMALVRSGVGVTSSNGFGTGIDLVRDFTLDTSYVDTTGSGLGMVNSAGTNTVTNSIFTGSSTQINVTNEVAFTTPTTWNVSGTTFSNGSNTSGAGFNLNTTQAATVQMTGNTFTSVRGVGARFASTSPVTANITFTGNTIDGATLGGGVNLNHVSPSVIRANVSGNSLRNLNVNGGIAATLSGTDAAGTLDLTVANNTLGTGTAGSGTAGSGLAVTNASWGRVRTNIRDNNFRNYNRFGMDLALDSSTTSANPEFDATLSGNSLSVSGDSTNTYTGVRVRGIGSAAGATGLMCLNAGAAGAVNANSLASAGFGAGSDVTLTQSQAVAFLLAAPVPNTDASSYINTYNPSGVNVVGIGSFSHSPIGCAPTILP